MRRVYVCVWLSRRPLRTSTVSFPSILCPRITPTLSNGVEIAYEREKEKLIDEIKLTAEGMEFEGERGGIYIVSPWADTDVNNGTARFEGKWGRERERGKNGNGIQSRMESRTRIVACSFLARRIRGRGSV